MVKRRRERDRPKSGPDAAYNPNKRVLLSYGDDDEEEIQDAAQAATGAPQADAQLASYQMDSYSPEPVEEDARAGADAVECTDASVKEENGEPAEATEQDDALGQQEEDDEFDHESTEDIAKAYTAASRSVNQNVRRNDKTSQWPTLGLQSYQWEEDHEDEDYDSATEDAMAYLRTVRSERQAMPEVLVAPRRTLEEATSNQKVGTIQDQYKHADAYFDDDEAYIGSPDEVKPQVDDTDPQAIFTQALKKRFLEQRKQMHVRPSKAALAELDYECPMFLPRGDQQATSDWRHFMSSKAPQPAHLRSLDQDTVFVLCDLTQRTYLAKDRNITNKISAWIWSLLARLDDVGNMNNDQVYMLRELGKHALLLQLAIFNPEYATHLPAPNPEEAKDTPADAQASVEQAPATNNCEPSEKVKTRPRSRSTEVPSVPYPTENTKATLDMIVIIVGEVFRQKDILDCRHSWSSSSNAG